MRSLKVLTFCPYLNSSAKSFLKRGVRDEFFSSGVTSLDTRRQPGFCIESSAS